jgi:hypothetical protein
MSLQTVEIEAFSGPTSVLIGGGNQPSIVFINQGPAGTGGGATSFAELTDKATADIPTINIPLATALSLKAPLASPTFTGTVVLPSTTSIGTVTNTEIGYVDGVTSSIQTQLNAKAPLASPTFTGIVTAPRIKGKCDGLELECKAGQAITAGQVVYVTGASGTNVIVGLARADTEITSSKTIGVSESTLALNDIGYVITEGLMTVDLTVASTVTVGDPIWLSGTTAGGMLFGIANKPSYPYHQVYLGVVTRKTGTTKVTEIYVKVQNGFEISELSDVSIVDPMEGQALMRNATKWTNRDLVSADISDASVNADADTLALRNIDGELKGTNVYCTGTDIVTSGKLNLYNQTLSSFSTIQADDNVTSFLPPAGSGFGFIELEHSNGGSLLAFSNSTFETYTFPVDGGTLLANTGNLAGLTNLPTSRTSLGLGTGNSPTFAGVNISTDVILTSKATRTLRLGAADANPPLTQTLAVQSATGTANVAGATFTIAGSQGTGSGAGGSIVFQTAAAGTGGGITPNALATVLTIASTGLSTFSGSAIFGGNIGVGNITPGGVSFSVYGANNAYVNIGLAGHFRFVGAGSTDIASLIYNTGALSLTSAGSISWTNSANSQGTVDLLLTRDAANTLAQRRGTNAQTSRIYDTYGSSTDYHRLAIATGRATATMTGASVTLTGLIPAGAVVVGVTTKVTTEITGATSFSVGTTVAPTRFGTTLPLIIGSTSDNRNWTSGTIECFPTATDIVLTAIGLNFTAGVVYVSVQYMTGQAD